ncbi:MAG: class I SAM-dependent methyltransferase [Promethearchaeota archaeon]|nr:MAG: class I SAM-dependent methyltransferase [Candidatus Lokiarchaeota archaeon]
MNAIGLVVVIIGIIVMFYFFWPMIKGAPWVPTGMKKVRKMLALADLKPDEVLYDLGCGDGRFIVKAARKFGAKAVGIEINLFLYLWCQLIITILGLRRRVKIIYGNFFKHNLSEADVVICYLLPETNDRLEHKLIRELKPTARVISNSFVFNKLPIVSVDIDKGIYVYYARMENLL